MTSPTHTFSVPGISCEHCKHAIEEKVAPVAGVEAVGVDVDAKSVTVTGGERSDLVAAISAAGYDVV